MARSIGDAFRATRDSAHAASNAHRNPMGFVRARSENDHERFEVGHRSQALACSASGETRGLCTRASRRSSTPHTRKSAPRFGRTFEQADTTQRVGRTAHSRPRQTTKDGATGKPAMEGRKGARARHDHGAPDRIRTCDRSLRRRLLYPSELPGRAAARTDSNHFPRAEWPGEASLTPPGAEDSFRRPERWRGGRSSAG